MRFFLLKVEDTEEDGIEKVYPWWNDTKYTSCVEVFPIYPTVVLEANPTG